MISPLLIASTVDINGPAARKYTSRDTVYISPSGKDGYLGSTPDLPVKTLRGVKNLISKLKVGDAKNINIEFIEGNYKAEEFFFNRESKFEYFKDSEGGNSVYNLTFKPYNKGSVVFDNSTTYTGFVSAGSLWKMEIDPFDMRKLNMFGFVNDVRTVPARWPKYGVSIDQSFTVGGISYRRAVDSTGFLQSMYSYQIAGGDRNRTGAMGILDYREHYKTIAPLLTTSLVGYKQQPNVFYIQYNYTTNLQIFANQSTIATPNIQKTNYTDGPYYVPIVDLTVQMLSACPVFIYDNTDQTVEEYNESILSGEYNGSDIWLGKYSPDYLGYLYPYSDEGSYNYYFRDTSLADQFAYIPAVITLSGLNWWIPDGGGGDYYYPRPLRPIYEYEPSNLDPYAVCSVEGENTVINENGKYYFYYKPTLDDQLAGIDDCVLKTYNVGSSDTWVGRMGINNVFKNSNGILYGNIPDKYSTYTTGFGIVNPNYTNFYDLTFDYCVSPLTLVTPISTTPVPDGNAQMLDAISQYSTNINISGCKLYNSYGVGIQMNSTSNARIEKNLVYSTEGGGIAYRQGGHNIIINNNIIKSSQQIDTRMNGDGYGSLGNLQIDGAYYLGHRAKSLTGVQISNNDFSFAGNNMAASVGQDLSAYNNKVYNSGFGTNSDMACMYSGFSWPSVGKFNYFQNNLIYHSRNDGNFLASGIYIDGGSDNMQIENNIISKVHTGICYANVTNGRVVNNIVYDTKQIAFYQGVNKTVSSYIYDNILVPGLYKDSRNSGSMERSNVGWSSWFASSHVNRIQSHTNVAILSGSDGKKYHLNPAFSWKGKLKYVAFGGGGVSSILSSPVLYFDGSNWVVADYNGTSSLYPYVSSINTAMYDNPWDVPESSWINLSSNGYLNNNWYFKNFKCVVKSDHTYGISTPAISADNNLYWSLMPASSHPESDSLFFNIVGKTFDDRLFYSTMSSISSLYCDDSSRPDIFANYIKPVDVNSKLADPLFADPEHLDFSLDPDSPAYDLGFQDIDTSNMGVYNTDDDPNWVELANTLKPQPVIFGNTNWADFETIPYPYNPNIEYYSDNNPILNQLNDLRTMTPWLIGKTTVTVISSNAQGLSGEFTFNKSLTASDNNITIVKPNDYILDGKWTSSATSGRWTRQSMNVSQFGAKGDGVTDDRPAIQRAIDYCSDNGIKDLHFDSAVYFLGSTTTGVGTTFSNGYVGYGAGENLNIGYYPESESVIRWNNMMNPEYINYAPTNPKKINLNLIGTGSTVLRAYKADRINAHSGHAAIIALRENIDKFKIQGVTLLWDSDNICNDYEFQSHGIIIASNYGGATYGRRSFWAIDRNQIDILECKFINCHRAITSGSTILPGRGVDTVNIIGCEFLYPKGSDSTATSGGSQVMLFDADVRNLNIINNFAEGSTYIPVRSPNTFPKDGFLFGGAINNRIVGNTMERFSVETLVPTPNGPSIWCMPGNTVPPVGGSMTLSAANVRKIVGGGGYTSVDHLTAIQGFVVGEVISFSYDGPLNGLLGLYRIDSYNEIAAKNIYKIGVTRVSGSDFSGLRTLPVGTVTVDYQRASPIKYHSSLSSNSIIIDNIFTSGYSLSTTTKTQKSHQPAVRSDAGNVYLSGNDIASDWAFYAAGQSGGSFTDKWVVEYNNVYRDANGGNGVRACGNSNVYDTTIRYNNFYHWTDFVNNNSLYYDAPKMSSQQSGVSLNWGHYTQKNNFVSSDSMGRASVTDNNFYFTYPLSASKVTLVEGATHFDTISGNTIINMSPD